VFAYLDIRSSCRASPSEVTLRNGINLTDRTPSPEASGDRAAAHMSLHLTDNVKEPTHLCPPGKMVPGVGYRLIRDTNTVAVRSRPPPLL